MQPGSEGASSLINAKLLDSKLVFMPLCTIQVGEQKIPARSAQIWEFTTRNSDGWSLIMTKPTILCCAAMLHVYFHIISAFIP